MPNPGKEPYEIEKVECIRETDMAILVTIDDEEQWIPKSALHEDSEVKEKDDVGTLVVFTWFAEKEGL